MAHGIGDDAVDLRLRTRQLLDPIKVPQFARAHLAGRRSLRRDGRGIRIHAAENRGQHARGKSKFAHASTISGVRGCALGNASTRP